MIWPVTRPVLPYWKVFRTRQILSQPRSCFSLYNVHAFTIYRPAEAIKYTTTYVCIHSFFFHRFFWLTFLTLVEEHCSSFVGDERRRCGSFVAADDRALESDTARHRGAACKPEAQRHESTIRVGEARLRPCRSTDVHTAVLEGP